MKQNKSSRGLSVNQKFAQRRVKLSHLRHDNMADEEWEEDALYEIAMVAAVVTVTASCKIIAAKKRRTIWARPIFRGVPNSEHAHGGTSEK